MKCSGNKGEFDMGESISRKQVFSFFIQACYYLEKYHLLKSGLCLNTLNHEKEVEKIIQKERNLQNFDYLVPLLILAEQYYIENEDYNQSIMYLIECQCILEEDDPNNLLKVYLFLELGYIYELMGLYDLSNDYYFKALSLEVEKKIPLLMNYTFERMAHVVIVSCDHNAAVNFNKLITNYREECISNRTKLIFDLALLYSQKNYEKILIQIDQFERQYGDGQFEDFSLVIQSFKVQAFYHLKKFEQITWKEFELKKLKPSSYPYFLMYWLTQQLVNHQDELEFKVEKAIKGLKESKYSYLLKSFYYWLVGEDCIKENEAWCTQIYDQYIASREQLYYEENSLKSRIQHSYHSYKQYYQNMEPVKFYKNYRVISWDQMSAYYRYEYTNQMVLGFLMIDDCFYSDFPEKLKDYVIDAINEVLQGDITFSFHNHGIWFYFKACTGETKLKQKLNNLLKPLYDRLKIDYTVSFCIPRFATFDFEKTAQLVYEGFYETVIQAQDGQPYDVSFCQSVSEQYSSSKNIRLNIMKSYEADSFIVLQNNFYYRDSKELFGIEVKGQFQQSNHFISLMEGKKGWAKDILILEMEMFTLEQACKFIRNSYNKKELMPYLFIKLSRETLTNQLIIGRILRCLEQYDLSNNQIVISINEDVLFEENERLQRLIKRLHQLEIKIALDDYGTGSLTGSIRNLKIDYLKISPNLIQYLNSSQNSSSIIQSLVNVCSRYDVKICCSDLEGEVNQHLISDLAIDVISEGYSKRKLVV